MSVVTYESSESIAVIAIDRPEKRNALSVSVVDELADAWRRFSASDDRIAVLTATGDQSFTVGADLNDIPHNLWRAVPGIGVEVEKPIVGAVAGWVVGGGLVLANQCDLLVAADNTMFLYPEAKVGFSGGLISSLAARIPHKIAMEVLLVGEALAVQRAYEIGFVNRIVPVGQQRTAALDYARKLAANAPLVLKLLKRFVGRTLPKGPSELAGIARRDVDAVTESDDLSEGLAARKQRAATSAESAHFTQEICDGFAAFRARLGRPRLISDRASRSASVQLKGPSSLTFYAIARPSLSRRLWRRSAQHGHLDREPS